MHKVHCLLILPFYAGKSVGRGGWNECFNTSVQLVIVKVEKYVLHKERYQVMKEMGESEDTVEQLLQDKKQPSS